MGKCKVVYKIMLVLKPGGRQAGFSGAAVSVLGLEYHQADHDRDQAYWSNYQRKNNGWWRVAQLLCGAISEEPGVNIHKYLFHKMVRPRDQEAVKNVLCAVAQVAVQPAKWRQKVSASWVK